MCAGVADQNNLSLLRRTTGVKDEMEVSTFTCDTKSPLTISDTDYPALHMLHMILNHLKSPESQELLSAKHHPMHWPTPSQTSLPRTSKTSNNKRTQSDSILSGFKSSGTSRRPESSTMSSTASRNTGQKSRRACFAFAG